MENEQIYITTGSEETKKLGDDFAKKLKNGDFLALYGNLGSGKTTFIQGLAKGLGIKRRIISPTFIIIRTYDLSSRIKDLRSKTFYHIDLYRIDSVKSLGINQIIEDKNNIIALEWAEKMGDLLPKKRYEIYFNYVNENQREIRIKKYE